jgi:hypothetical protein
MLGTALEHALRPLVDGFSLTAVGRHEHDLHRRVECADGFADVTSLHTEDDDRVTLAAGGRTLEVDLAPAAARRRATISTACATGPAVPRR